MSRTLDFTDLEIADKELVAVAHDVSKRAYAPYSGFEVGAAIRTKSGHIYTAANLENASYGLSLCAEIIAIGAANAAGDLDVETIAIVGHKAKQPRDESAVVTPCGRCRQIIFEASQVANREIRILSASGDLGTVMETTISELLPNAFGPHNLGMGAEGGLDNRSRQRSVSDLVGGGKKASA